ncbi:MAG TPA: chorismate-binding protein [Candidatus Thermoplasmatota archaeon]|nr:chorismate-binding protein [Candidatus Thermoplasmatota archaeon]
MAASRQCVALHAPDPLEAYVALRDAGRQPMLLLAAGRHPEARWSFVAFDPVREVRVQGDHVEEVRPDGATATRGNVIGHLRAALADTPRLDDPVPFSGGWVGFFGYGFARHADPSMPRMREAATPDALLRLCTGALAIDHRGGRAFLFCTDLAGDAEAARRSLAAAAQALALARPVPPPAPQPLSWRESLPEAAFEAGVRRLRARIADGDLFQANLATRWSTPWDGDPARLLAALREANPSPFMALFEEPDFALVSGSPEQLLGIEGDVLRSRPIAGTRKRGADDAEDQALEDELASDAKEAAEHTMLVDLVRNDLARVCRPGTVQVAERMSVERYRHVMHLVSRVEGRLRPEAGFLDALLALFPGGTVTGAPKLRACQRIEEAEPVPRGPYTGSAGFVGWGGTANWSILIRSVVLEHDLADGTTVAHVHAGSGIVAGSDPRREWKEAGRKARALLEAAAGEPARPGSAHRVGDVTPRGRWEPPAARPSAAHARVLLIDNEDSFVHNLADYCRLLGAATHVVRNDVPLQDALQAFAPTHVVLSPGPGWPQDARATLEAAATLHGRLPMLGVCLGHQAIAHAHGAVVELHPDGPVHGRADRVHHTGAGLFAGLPSPLLATRYHSLAVRPGTLGPDWVVDATLQDGTVMAVRHRTRPTFGLQFHPESLCTERGLELIARFLEARR